MVSFEVNKQPLRCIKGVLGYFAAIVSIWLQTQQNGTDGIHIEKAIFVSGREEIFSSKKIKIKRDGLERLACGKN